MAIELHQLQNPAASFDLCLSLSSTVTETTLALDSAYTYGSAGDAFYIPFIAPASGNLTDFWLRVISYTGTWSSTDQALNVQIREGLNGNGKPGTTLTGSFTVDLSASPTGWVKTSSLSIALTAGALYSVVIADADGSASNYCTISRHAPNARARGIFGATTISSTDGFSTAGTSTTGMAVVGLKVDGVVYAGAGVTSSSTLTNNTNERGLRFRSPTPLKLVGFTTYIDFLVMLAGSALKLYADATAPGGTALMSYTPTATTLGGASTIPVLCHHPLPPASQYDIAADTWYRFVLDPVASTTTPRRVSITGSPDSEILAALQPFGGDCYYTIESAGAWADTTTDGFLFSPVFAPAEATGGVSAEPFRTFIG